MENAILIEDKQIEKGFKQIYPNNNDVEISLKSWGDGWPWISKGWETRRLTIYENIKEWNKIFFKVDVDYTDDYSVKLYLTKSFRTKTYGVDKIYIKNGDDEPLCLTKVNSKDYKIIAKKIDKIYFNINEHSLLILTDKNFISKKEKKLLKEKSITEAANNSIEELFN